MGTIALDVPKTFTARSNGRERKVTATLIREGRPQTIGRHTKREVTLGEVFRIEVDGELIGTIESYPRRESIKHRRIITSQWYSVGWWYTLAGSTISRQVYTAPSKSRAVMELLADSARSKA